MKEKDKVDLNKPAFGSDAQRINTDTKNTEEAVAEPVVVKTEEEPEVSVETKVPYSRFKKYHDLAIQSQREAEEWKARAEQIKSDPVIDPQDEAFKLWIENFGDSEASKKAFQNQQRINQIQWERDAQKTREQALEAVRNERYEEAQRTEQNVEVLDNQFEDLSALVGRDLTDKEQSAILDIVDDYTPKDRDGNYAGEILSFDKAWEIYELREQVGKNTKINSRNQVASLTGSRSEGETSAQVEKDKTFNPSWGALDDAIRRRL